MTERTCHFICSLSAIEALGGFLSPSLGNGKRFREFVERYFPDPYPSQAGALWKLRNDAVHVFLTGPYNLMHHSGHLHLTQDKDGLTILNAEDFYAALVLASKRYFDTVKTESSSAKGIRREGESDWNLGSPVDCFKPADGSPRAPSSTSW